MYDALRGISEENKKVILGYLYNPETELPYLMKPLAEKLGIETFFGSARFTLASLLKKEGGKYKITVNRENEKIIRRHSFAYEIAYYLLLGEKMQEGQTIIHTLGELLRPKSSENEVMQLALYLLMPDDMFHAVLHHFGKNSYVLAGIFDVSKDAVEAKMRILGVNPEPEETGGIKVSFLSDDFKPAAKRKVIGA